jgi:hypothetical protein
MYIIEADWQRFFPSFFHRLVSISSEKPIVGQSLMFFWTEELHLRRRRTWVRVCGFAQLLSAYSDTGLIEPAEVDPIMAYLVEVAQSALPMVQAT